MILPRQARERTGVAPDSQGFYFTERVLGRASTVATVSMVALGQAKQHCLTCSSILRSQQEIDRGKKSFSGRT